MQTWEREALEERVRERQEAIDRATRVGKYVKRKPRDQVASGALADAGDAFGVLVPEMRDAMAALKSAAARGVAPAQAGGGVVARPQYAPVLSARGWGAATFAIGSGLIPARVRSCRARCSPA